MNTTCTSASSGGTCLRAFSAALGFSVAFILSACGGGGGGGSTTPTPPVQSTCSNGATDFPTCSPKPTIALQGKAPDGDQNVQVTGTTTLFQFGYTGTVTTATGTFVWSCNGINYTTTVRQTLDTSKSTIAFAVTITETMPNSTVCTVSAADGGVTVSGPGGTSTKVPVSTSFTTAAPAKLSYTDRVYTLYTGNYPFSVKRNTDGTFTVAKVKNMTPFTTGFYPLANCWMAKAPLTDGKVLVSCQDATSLGRHVLYIDPIKDELYEYTGVIPATLQYTTNPDKSVTLPAVYDWIWGHSYDQANPPAWAENVTVGIGTYYTTYTVTWVLLFKDTAGVVSTVKSGEPLDKTNGGSFTLLISYSN